MVAQTRHNPSNRKRLTLPNSIATKGISTDALLAKLTALHAQLAALDQETVDPKSLEPVRSELIATALLHHKDRGVKAYTACCLADILRLYAPEAPYTQHQLRDIFQFFFQQLLAGFKGSDEPYYTQYFHLLESLSTIKSVVLVCDLPTSEEMLHSIFRDMFVIVKRDFAKKVELFIKDILVALIDECTSLPSEVLEIIMAQFMDKNAKIDQPGYRLAVSVCNTAADRLQRHVCQYFGDLLTGGSSGNASDSDSDEPSHNNNAKSDDNLRQSHTLVVRLHSSCPNVLPSVIPILEAELRSDKANARVIATQTVGQMLADKSGGDFMRKYPTTFQAWVTRKADVSVAVRLKLVESLPSLLGGIPDAQRVLEETLEQKLFDPDEKVRAATCKALSTLDYETALRYTSESLLRHLAGRALDKKRSVRYEALNAISKLFNLAYPEIENNDEAAIRHFGWIPDAVIMTSNVGSELRALVEQMISTYILPLPNISTSSATKERDVDETAWTNRLLTVLRFMYEKSRKFLINLSGLVTIRPNMYDAFVEACIKNNGGIIDSDEEAVIKRLKAIIQTISASFPDPLKAAEDLNAFAKLNENRLYKLLKTMMDPLTDLKGLIKARNDFFKRLDQVSSSSSSSSTSASASAAANAGTTLGLFVARASFSIVNQSSIPTLLKRVQNAALAAQQDFQTQDSRQSLAGYNSLQNPAVTGALTILMVVAKNAPLLYKPHLGELKRIVYSTSGTLASSGGRDGEGMVREVALRALASLVRLEEEPTSSSSLGSDKKLTEKIVKIVLGRKGLKGKAKATEEDMDEDDAEDSESEDGDGVDNGTTDWRQAKFATRYLAHLKDGEEICGQIVESIARGLKNKKSTNPLSVAQIASLVQIAKFAPKAFEERSDVIIPHVVNKVLMVPIYPDPDDVSPDQEDEEWVENDHVSDRLRSKILALKLCRVRSLASAQSTKAMEIVQPLLKMLVTLLEQEGSLEGADSGEDTKAKARMRLQAAVSLLHLCTVEAYATAIQTKFVRLVCVIQDTCFNIRQIFLQKLIILLQQRKLSPKFNVIPFMSVLDPEEDVKNLAASYIEAAKRRMPTPMRQEYLELIFIRLLHLLAHHPDFATEQDDILDMGQYVNFYLDLIATPDNVSLLYHLATKGKTVRDAESHSKSTQFYQMCEIAQILIGGRAEAQGWLLPSHPGKVKLPADILRPLPNAEAVNGILKTDFLPKEAKEWLAEKFKLGSAKEKKERREKEKERGKEERERERKERREEKEKEKEKEKEAGGSVKTKRKSAPTKANGHTKRSRRKRDSDDEEDQEEEEQKEESDVEMDDDTPSSPKPTRKKPVPVKKNTASRAERLSARTRAKEKQPSPPPDSDEE